MKVAAFPMHAAYVGFFLHKRFPFPETSNIDPDWAHLHVLTMCYTMDLYTKHISHLLPMLHYMIEFYQKQMCLCNMPAA